MTDQNDDPPRRLAERIRYHADRAPEDEDRAIYQRQMRPPNPIEYLNDDELRAHRRLIEMEPELTGLVEQRRSWALVLSTLKTIAVWLTAMSGGLLVARELLKVMHQ